MVCDDRWVKYSAGKAREGKCEHLHAWNTPPEYALENRFIDETVETGGSRTTIFKKYTDIYLSDLRFIFLGTGVTRYVAVAGTGGAIHNGTQQILVCCGAVGLIVYLVLLIGATQKACKARKHEKMFIANWLPVLSVIAFTQTIQFLNSTMLMLPYVIGAYAIRVKSHFKGVKPE